MDLGNLTQLELFNLQKQINKELKNERFRKVIFQNILKLKKQHFTLEKKLTENIEVAFAEIQEHLEFFNYYICTHFHYEKLRIDIYNGTKDDSAKLIIEDFKIAHITDNFDKDLLKIITSFLFKGANAK